MYLKSEDEERDLIEQAIQDAQHAQNDDFSARFAKLFAGVKSWFTKGRGADKKSDHIDPSSNAPLVS